MYPVEQQAQVESAAKGHHPSPTSVRTERLLRDRESEKNPNSTSPQKHMKNRSKSTEEMQHSKKAFSSQKSLPGRPELDRVKECPDGSDTPPSSTEEEK
ncbi:Hypothetical protein SMAX5B_008816 [Scophthalmus maximus]|uniref:Uncharacterized protein n=1 Tax=Scophthalmus maximus TaxID=52904 RepID=A0A2U9C967_SCOMX|nr:Hypothetical protein SMAX5B_008816 [Scophthalmus maximus]